MKFSLSNLTAQNTPVNLQKIGSVLLILSAIGVAILGMPAAVALIVPAGTPPMILPGWLITVATWIIGVGVLGKTITAFTGVTNATELQKLIGQTNKTLDKTTDDSVPLQPLKVTDPSIGSGSNQGS